MDVGSKDCGGGELKNYKVSDIIKILEKDGWFLDRQNGSHRQYKHPEKKGLVTISCHKLSKDVPISTLKSIMKQAQINEEDL
jgi:predicted RNA binding protein YcfA (HicA-like mRNA interferase family)